MTSHLQPVPDVGAGVVDGFDQYTEYLWALGLSPRTVRIYSRALERFLAFAMAEGFDPIGADVMSLAAYAQELPNTAASKRQHRVALRHWFESQGRDDAPLNGIRVPPKKRPRSRALEPHQAAALARTGRRLGHPQGTAVLLGLYLGLRREEIAKARWDHFDKSIEWYTVTGKRGVTAEIPVHPVVAEIVAQHATAHPYVFPGRSTAHVNASSIAAWVSRVGKQAGIEHLSPHMLRHTAIATVNDATGDLRMAQEFARHANIETTVIYTRVGNERLRRAMEALTFLDL